MTTALNPRPDVPLPAGAVEAGPESWAFWDNEFRIFHGVDRVVSDPGGGQVAEVQTGGIQLPNGSIDTRQGAAPRVDVYVHADDGITAEQSRALAAMLVEAADQIDGWTR